MKGTAFISKHVLSGEYYFLNLTPSATADGVVVCGGLEYCAPDYRIQRNRFKYHSVEYVVNGEGFVTLGKKTFPLHPHALFSYGPATRHEIVSDPKKPLVKYFVDFAGPRFSQLLKGHPLGQHRPFYYSAQVHELFEALQKNGREKGARVHGICACLLELLMLQTADTALMLKDAESSAHQTFLQVRDALERDYLRFHALPDVARACHLDASYMCRLFKRYSNESPYEMLIRLKMRHAADRLNNASLHVKDVAVEVGFQDPYHFSRVFKSIYGTSPKAFMLFDHR